MLNINNATQSVMFAGDSGDGIQLLGELFATGVAKDGSKLAGLPDYPAEIRAPLGTIYGVSAYTVRILKGNHKLEIVQVNEKADILLAMNFAALQAKLNDAKEGATIYLDKSLTDEKIAELKDQLKHYSLQRLDMNSSTIEVAKSLNLSRKDALRSKNMWALGFISQLFDIDIDSYHDWLDKKFAKNDALLSMNKKALEAGNNYAETIEAYASNTIKVAAKAKKDKPKNNTQPQQQEGKKLKRLVNGSQAIAWGLVAGSCLVDRDLLYASYPITPASPVLHIMMKLARQGLLQASQTEDEISACCMALGAGYAGNIGATVTSGPGLDLMSETLGLAVMAELPLVVVDAQRGGPSTGLPTKPEQSDLLLALYGRHGDSPIPVLAASDPIDAFDMAMQAIRIAVEYMTPVILLTDAAIANSSCVWQVPKFMDFDKHQPDSSNIKNGRHAKTLAPARGCPGQKGGEIRIGGIEKDAVSGGISYDPDNHKIMSYLRQEKIDKIKNDIPAMKAELGKDKGKVLILSWGSPSATAREAATHLVDQGHQVSSTTIKHIYPLPHNTASFLDGFDFVLIPEINQGQLGGYLKSKCDLQRCKIKQLNSFKYFSTDEIKKATLELIA